MRLAHITDPHLTSPGSLRLPPGKRWLSWLSWHTRRSGRHRRERLAALVGHLQEKRPGHWAITGDLCQTGLESEIREAADWLSRNFEAESTLVVPGNHDHFAEASIEAIARQWAEYLHTDLRQPPRPVVRKLDDAVLIGLDSAVVTPAFKASGRLGEDMLARLSGVLQEQRGRFRIVLIHHPPVPGICSPRKALEDASELSEVLAAHGAGMVLHGHLHRNLDYRIETVGGDSIEVFCTASASAAGKQGPAAARIFDIGRRGKVFEVTMALVALDASGNGHVIDKRNWSSNG